MLPKLLIPTLALLSLASGLAAEEGNERASLVACQDHPEHRCGKLAVFEDRAKASGRTIELNVMLIPARTSEPAQQALFYIAGGPGGSSVDEGEGIGPLLEPLRESHDLVFVDLRGTGESNRLGCVANGDPEKNLQGYFDRFLTSEQLLTCRQELEARADLRFYTTPLAMDDLEEVRERLGYGKIDLFGTSYGTRAAQVLMKRHPQKVRSALLMGVASLDALLPLTHSQGSERALDLIITACLEDADCKKAYPNLRAEYEALWNRLEAAPAVLDIQAPGTDKKVKIRFTRGNFAESIRFYSYSPASGVVVPALLHRAFEGDLQPFAEQVLENEVPFRKYFAWGEHLSVTCSEDVPFYPADTKAYSRGTFLGDYRIDMQRELCAAWPKGEVPADLHDPVEADIPTLLLSGELDPVTPPWMAREVARHLPRAKHVLLEYGHHGPDGLSNMDCLAGMINSFLARGNAEGLDTSCVETMKRPAWVTDYDAWKAEQDKKMAARQVEEKG